MARLLSPIYVDTTIIDNQWLQLWYRINSAAEDTGRTLLRAWLKSVIITDDELRASHANTASWHKDRNSAPLQRAVEAANASKSTSSEMHMPWQWMRIISLLSSADGNGTNMRASILPGLINAGSRSHGLFVHANRTTPAPERAAIKARSCMLTWCSCNVSVYRWVQCILCCHVKAVHHNTRWHWQPRETILQSRSHKQQRVQIQRVIKLQWAQSSVLAPSLGPSISTRRADNIGTKLCSSLEQLRMPQTVSMSSMSTKVGAESRAKRNTRWTTACPSPRFLHYC